MGGREGSGREGGREEVKSVEQLFLAVNLHLPMMNLVDLLSR